VGGKRGKKEEKNEPSCSGGLHIVDVSNPFEPQFIGCYSDDGYTHDAQCIVYNGPDTRYVDKEICVCFNADTVTIVDVSDKSNIIQLSRTVYEKTGYTHQGWVSPSNQKYVVFGDETDEKNLGGPTRTLVLNIEDLRAPTNFREFFGTTRAIDHNLYIRNAKQQGYGDQFLSSDLIYQSNYQAGLRILQVIDIDTDYDQVNNIQQVGYFDTFPGSDDTKMEGAWSVYPFFKSNLVAISSVEGGLFLVKPNLEGVLFTTAPPPPVFENLGIGYCGDSTGSYNNPNWKTKSDCFDLPACQAKCKAQDQCLGISWASTPLNYDDNCYANFLPRCVVYYGTVVAIEKTSLVTFEEYTCYRYGKPAVVPTDAPTTTVPTNTPTNAPTDVPTTTPTATPTTSSTTTKPTYIPTGVPAVVPTSVPSTAVPSLSAAPSSSPMSCVDTTGDVKLVEIGKKSCAKIRKKGYCKIKVKNEGGKKAKEFCPTACSVGNCVDCVDQTGLVKLVKKGKKTCAQIRQNNLCKEKVKITGRPKAKTLCPTACSVDGCKLPSSDSSRSRPSSNPTSVGPNTVPSTSPSACMDDDEYRYKGKKKCLWVKKLDGDGLSKFNFRCNLHANVEGDDTKLVSDFCRATCHRC